MTKGNARKLLLWGAVLLITLALRLTMLSTAPLSPDEALLAIPALEASRGAEWLTDAPESPLLLTGNALIFLLLGPNEGTARLLPALLGTALVAMPWFWRRRLGEQGALIAAGLLALSPIALFGARHVDATIVGTLGAALVITALSTSQRRPDLLLAAGLALGLTGGPAFYDALLPGLAAWVLTHRLFPEQRALPQRKHLIRGLLIGLGAALLISVGFGLRWGGWAGPASGLATWLQTWWSPDQTGPLNLAQLLLYEPVTLLLAAIGLRLSTRVPRPFAVQMAPWIVTGALLTLLRPGTEPLSLLTVLVPLALLAGQTAGDFAKSFRPTSHTYLHVALTLLFWIFAGLIIVRQTTHLQNDLEFFLILLVLLIQGLLVAGFATLVGTKRAWQGLLIATIICLLVIQVSFAWRANFVAATAPHEPLVTSLASRDLYNLQETIEMLCISRGVSPENLDIAILAHDSGTTAVVRWALRTWPALRVTQAWPAEPVDLVITPEDVTPVAGIDETYQGMRFTAALQPTILVPSCTQLLPPVCPGAIEWYIYRPSPVPAQKTRIMLWTPPTPTEP
jgi:4-amino-4-deoxy-L-arabinose transferase-like glycosyltransferase